MITMHDNQHSKTYIHIILNNGNKFEDPIHFWSSRREEKKMTKSKENLLRGKSVYLHRVAVGKGSCSRD